MGVPPASETATTCRTAYGSLPLGSYAMSDGFDDLVRPSPGRSAGDLAAQVSAALGEPPGRVAIEPEDDEMAWLTREGVRLSRFNAQATGGAAPERRAAFALALADLVRRYDELRPTIEDLEVGGRYRVDYKHERLRRTFRVTGELLEVSPWQPADGPSGGGWTLTLETRPRFGKPSRFRVGSDVLTTIAPD